jgi:hypothetical protein
MAFRNALTTPLGALFLPLLLVLGGCLGADDPELAGDMPSDLAADEIYETRVTGSVGDGPIVGARLRVFSSSGQLLQESSSNSTADYDIVIKTQGKNYPLSLEADMGVDIVTGGPPDFRLVSGILRPNTRSFSNLNPFTTLIFDTARKSGGISDSTVGIARDAILARFGFGLDKNLIPDPVLTAVDHTNVHVYVKTSETLGELVRRTRDVLPNHDGDAVIAALAADLTDGLIDGRGAKGASARTAAVANVASAAVLVQAMANRLHVYNTNATGAMDNAIRHVQSSAPASVNTANVQIPEAAFHQVVRALRAAEVVVDDARIGQTIEVMQSAIPGSLPADIAPRLPSGIDTVLDSAVQRAATATDAQLAAINTAAQSDPSAPSGDPGDGDTNQPPVISGTPDTALVVGTPWSFQPKASDPDGDPLSFSIQGKPAWTSFDSKTGKLSGTPASAGSFGPVTITVSDGQAHASLASFTLHVAEPTLGSANVSWTPPTERTDGSALTDLAGYKVYYGTDPNSLTHVVNITNAGQTSHFVENLASGTWYFAVTAYCEDGLESNKSTIGSKTI